MFRSDYSLNPSSLGVKLGGVGSVISPAATDSPVVNSHVCAWLSAWRAPSPGAVGTRLTPAQGAGRASAPPAALSSGPWAGAGAETALCPGPVQNFPAPHRLHSEERTGPVPAARSPAASPAAERQPHPWVPPTPARCAAKAFLLPPGN